MDYIGFYKQHVKDLKKEGKEYRGWCPFHSDKGSKEKGFSLNPETGLWFCHSGCGGGNAITFCKKKGILIDCAPDFDSDYTSYAYTGSISHIRCHPTKDGKRREWWHGTQRKGIPPETKPFNHNAIDHIKELKKHQDSKKPLWICEGEKDTLTMMEAGELAIGILSSTMIRVLDAVSYDSIKGIPIIIACDNDDAGRTATKKILQMFPWAEKIEWPEDKPEWAKKEWKGYDVTDLKEDVDGQTEYDFIEILKGCVVSDDPFYPLEKIISEKQERDISRDPNKLLGYDLKRFKELAKNIEGVQPGLYIVGADTNVGKTALLSNLTLDILDTNKDLTAIYFSLDDNTNIILNRFLGIITGMPINQVQRPQQTDKHKKMLQQGYDHLKTLAKSGRLFIRDASDIKNIDDLEGEIRRRSKDKLFVVVDALYNLDVGMGAGDQRKENIERANKLKNLVDIYNIPVVCSAELRKPKERKPSEKEAVAKKVSVPTLNDLMETGKFAYNANLVFLLYQDSKKLQGDKLVKLTMDYAKNKLSYFKDQGLLLFNRETSQIEEWVEGLEMQGAYVKIRQS